MFFYDSGYNRVQNINFNGWVTGERGIDNLLDIVRYIHYTHFILNYKHIRTQTLHIEF